MKQKLLFLGMLGLVLFFSCEKEEDVTPQQDVTVNAIDAVKIDSEVMSDEEALAEMADYNSRLKWSRSTIRSIAEHEYGRGPNDVGRNRTRYPYRLRYYMPSGDAWCSEFVSWVYKCAGASFSGGSYGGWMLNTHRKCKNWFSSRGRFYYRGGSLNNYTPRTGDYVRFIWASNGNGHSGIVRYVSGSSLKTVEGNYGNKVVYRTTYNYRRNRDLNGVGRR